MNNTNEQVKLLRWMLEDIRNETLEGVKHLTKEQLFQNPIKDEYPIGSYLMHLAECDISWLEIISGIKQPEDLKEKSFYDKWFDPSGEASPPKEPLELSEYLETIATARKNFLDYLSTLNDSNLEDTITREDGKTFSRNKKWIIYHIIEHEAHHRGQMFLLIRKAGLNKK